MAGGLEDVAGAGSDRVEAVMGAVLVAAAGWAVLAATFGGSVDFAVAPFFLAFGFFALTASAEVLAAVLRLPPVEDPDEDPGLVHGRGVRRTSYVLGGLLFGVLGVAFLSVGTWLSFGSPAVDLPALP